MKKVIDYIYENQFENLVINESFQSSFLSDLAKKIKNSESKRHKSLSSESEKRKDKYTSSFSNIFSSIIDNNNKPINIKWDKVKDEDFVLYKSKDKKFKEICNDIFNTKLSSNQKAMIISCEPNTKNIIYFTNAINGRFNKDSWTRENGAVIFQFDVPYTWWDKGNRGVDKKVDTVRKSSRGYNNYRVLNQIEAFDLLKGYDNYVLKIDDSLIDEYQQISISRDESKKGMINFDKASLDKILKDQQDRYKAFVKSVKIKKLRSNDKALYEEIKNLNLEIISLNEEIMNNSNNWDLLSAMENIIKDFSYAFTYYYRYFISNAESQSPDADESDRKYYKKNADKNLIDVQETIDKYKEEIKKIKSKMKI